MNLPTLIVLFLVAAALVVAILVWRRAGRSGCGCGSDRSEPASGCSGCSQSSGCPYCRK